MSPSKTAQEPSWEVRSCTEADCRALAIHLAKGCEEELKAFSKFTPLSVLLQGFANKAIIADGRRPSQPLAILDLKPVNETAPGVGDAAIWIGLTDQVVSSEWLWSFTNYAASTVRLMQADYNNLFTYVDNRNIRHRMFLERIGFELVEELPQFGPKEVPTNLYKRSRSKNV